MIRLADRSEFGWDLVNEYQLDELAADSDDEKKIAKAEKAAAQKALKKKKLTAGRGKSLITKGKDERPFKLLPAGQTWQTTVGGTAPPTLTGQGPSRVVSSRVLGPCFSCGEFGHLRSSCKATSSNKPYPLCQTAIGYCMSGERLLGECSRGSCMWNGKESGEWELHVQVEGDSRDMQGLDRSWEVVEGVNSNMKGRLKANYSYWETVVRAPTPVLKMIKEGYVLPLVSEPESRVFSNQRSAEENKVFVNKAVTELVDNGCIVEVDSPPIVCSPLSVVGR